MAVLPFNRGQFFDAASDQEMRESLVRDVEQKKRESDLIQKLNEIFNRTSQSGAEAIERQSVPLRQKLIAEEAALGRLRSPVSIAPLSRFEEQKQQSLSQLLTNLLTQRAGTETDFAKTLAGLGQSESQFGRELGFKRKTLAESVQQAKEDAALRRLQLDINKELGSRELDLGLGALELKKRNQPSQFQKETANVGGVVDILSGLTGGAKNLFGKDGVFK